MSENAKQESPTRADYMAGKVSHEEYYRAVARSAGISYAKSDILLKVRDALAAGDHHLNTIPLGFWDLRAAGLLPSISRAFKVHGDGDTLAGRVCVLKQAARDAVEQDHA